MYKHERPIRQSEYVEYRGKFDKSLVRIFPDRLPNNMIGFGFQAPYKGGPGRLNLQVQYFSEREYLQTKAHYLERRIISDQMTSVSLLSITMVGKSRENVIAFTRYPLKQSLRPR